MQPQPPRASRCRRASRSRSSACSQGSCASCSCASANQRLASLLASQRQQALTQLLKGVARLRTFRLVFDQQSLLHGQRLIYLRPRGAQTARNAPVRDTDRVNFALPFAPDQRVAKVAQRPLKVALLMKCPADVIMQRARPLRHALVVAGLGQGKRPLRPRQPVFCRRVPRWPACAPHPPRRNPRR